MFREMRRKRQLLPMEETVEVLEKCTNGVLGVTGDDGYPYTVPLSYVYKDGKIFFHCAKEGHKLDGIRRNDKVSFSVIERDDIVQETFTTHFKSAVVFGRARILEEPSEILPAIKYLAEKYSPDYLGKLQDEIEKSLARVCLVEIKIEHMTGKAAIEIVNGKNK